MFDLEEEVERWSKEFAGNTCGRNDRVEELMDHLYCEIENNIDEGLTEESAFLAATRRFGISEEIKAEFKKGRGIATVLCDAEANLKPSRLPTKRLALFSVLYLVGFAVLTFTLTYLFRGQEIFVYFTPVLFVLSMVPVYFVVADQKRAKAECAFFKRIFRRVF